MSYHTLQINIIFLHLPIITCFNCLLVRTFLLAWSHEASDVKLGVASTVQLFLELESRTHQAPYCHEIWINLISFRPTHSTCLKQAEKDCHFAYCLRSSFSLFQFLKQNLASAHSLKPALPDTSEQRAEFHFFQAQYRHRAQFLTMQLTQIGSRKVYLNSFREIGTHRHWVCYPYTFQETRQASSHPAKKAPI